MAFANSLVVSTRDKYARAARALSVAAVENVHLRPAVWASLTQCLAPTLLACHVPRMVNPAIANSTVATDSFVSPRPTLVQTVLRHAAPVKTVALVLVKEMCAPVSPMAHPAAARRTVAKALAKKMSASAARMANHAPTLQTVAREEVSGVKVTTFAPAVLALVYHATGMPTAAMISFAVLASKVFARFLPAKACFASTIPSVAKNSSAQATTLAVLRVPV
jgi:hypothetical protein